MRKLVVLFCIVAIQGCAFVDVQLPLEFEASESTVGPLSELTATTFQITSLEDERENPEIVGWVTNGYGAHTADVLTTRPTVEIVQEAIQRGLIANGHPVGEKGIAVSGTITEFWFDTDMNFWTVEFIGNMAVQLTFVDEAGQTLYSQLYKGAYSEKFAGGGTKRTTDVMNATLAALVEDLVFDEELIEILEAEAQRAPVNLLPQAVSLEE